MDLQLFSIQHAPRKLPVWHQILEDLGHPHPRTVAKVLGIGVRTVYRYNRHGHAPRSICLALFWLTRWGRADVHSQAINDALVAIGYAQALDREVKKLRSRIEHVLSLNESGAANQPFLEQ
jgi:predicted DNA-binding transcriptional regulator AlpA